MKGLLWVVFGLILVGGLYALLAPEDCSAHWLDYINAHAKGHDPAKDTWEADHKFTVARYCQVLGANPKAVTIYAEIIDKCPNTQLGQISEYQAGKCYESMVNFMEARQHYQNCVNNYPDFADSEWATKAKMRINDINAGRM